MSGSSKEQAFNRNFLQRIKKRSILSKDSLKNACTLIGIHNLGDIMKATVVDLRYKMNEVLKALDRRENVTLLYHGKIKGTIIPVGGKKTILVKDHPFFNMAQKETKSVSQKMDELRGSRFNDI
jgi:hypothetical protein